MRYFFVMMCALLPLLSQAQGYSYTRYDITDGLAGSTVFCMLQDRQGFLWFGTETGVSRFDGSHFKNYTVQDGLPDNQVLTMFEDSKGRIWMAPFNKSVCYFYKGKIYNQRNHPALRAIRQSGHVVSFAEDSKGNILLMQTSRMHLIRPNNTVKVFMFPDESVNLVCSGTNEHGNFKVVNVDSVYEIVNEQLVFVSKLNFPFPNYRYLKLQDNTFFWRTGYNTFHVKNPKHDVEIKFQSELWLSTVSIVSESLVSLNLQIGGYVYDLEKNAWKLYMPDESVAQVYQDREGNLWFCTLNHGAFMLNSQHIRNVPLVSSSNVQMSAYSIEKYADGTWLVGSDMTNLFLVKKNDAGNYYTRSVWKFRDNIPERVTAIVKDDDGTWWIGTDSRIVHFSSSLQQLHRVENIWGLKTLSRHPGYLVAATGRYVFRVDAASYQQKDTLWKERATIALEKNDTLYVGTLDGLFIVLKDSSTQEAGPGIPQLRNRIMDIRQDGKGAFWIATYAGVFYFDQGRITGSITEKTGLVSNICRTLEIFHDELWIGTNKGLQKVNIKDPHHPIVEYLLSNELSSDIINYVKADSNTIVVATPEGLSIVDKQMVSFNSRCDLYMDNIIVSGHKLPWDSGHFDLNDRDNNIRFEFAGISYRSGGDVYFDYRLQGLDTIWRRTHDNYLNYPTLPAGDYLLQLQAVNKFGIKSRRLAVPFTIEKMLWQKTWFQALLVLAIIAISWLVFSWRIKVIRKQDAEKAGILKKVSELEQLALKAQMNPHFIFNSLNSIQHYVLDKDIEGANRFITGFSRLIRQTLEISARHEITIAEEMNYLSTYLQLEQIRLENKFAFEVTAEPGLKPEECFIPPMILQPFVENCIRHGIRFRHDNNGRVAINFKKLSGYLECVVEDNGIGRKMAALHKSKNPIEYQSKGISLTTDRINLLNRSASRPIFLKIYDIENGTESAGTRVVISFPV